MRWLDFILGGTGRPHRRTDDRQRAEPLAVEPLEARTLLDATAVLSAGMLNIAGGPNNDRIGLALDAASAQLVVSDGGRDVARFASTAVNRIFINSGDGNDLV